MALTVSEVLWKRKPVIGSAVGGIKLQVIAGVIGFLVHFCGGRRQLFGDAPSERLSAHDAGAGASG